MTMVKKHMFGLAIKQFKIFRPVIIFNVVYMVNNFSSDQTSSKFGFHNQMRLSNISTFRDINQYIPSCSDGSSWMAIIKAFFRTIFSPSFTLTNKLKISFSANMANKRNLATLPVRIATAGYFAHPLQYKESR